MVVSSSFVVRSCRKALSFWQLEVGSWKFRVENTRDAAERHRQRIPNQHRPPSTTHDRASPATSSAASPPSSRWCTSSSSIQAILASPGTGMAFSGVLTATVLLAFAMTLLMGLYARLPFAVAPGMGLNAFFAFTIVLQQQVPGRWRLGSCSGRACSS